MSYRFVKVVTFDSRSLKQYYTEHPDVVDKSYSEQYAHLMSQAIGWADFYSRSLKDIGVDAYDIPENAILLQEAWAEENNVQVTGRELLMEQIKRTQPEVVMFEDAYSYGGEWITHLRQQVPSVRKVIGWCCAPYNIENLHGFSSFDFMLTCTPGFKKQFEDYGLKTYLLPHAFESSLLSRIHENNSYPELDFLFAGALFQGTGLHNNRIKYIEEILSKGIDLAIYGTLSETRGTLKVMMQRSVYRLAGLFRKAGLSQMAERLPSIKKALKWKVIPKRISYPDAILKNLSPPVFGIEMFKTLSKAKISFNIHVDAAGIEAGNMRLFEATGVGSCLVTDWKENINDLFEPDKEIVTYRSVEECVEKVKWLLAHPDECKAIAKAGQERTLKDHTFEKRAALLDEIIRNEFAKL